MTLKELYALLKTTDYPVAYHHFETPVSMPKIAYLITSADAHGSDENNLVKETSVRVELYTKNKDLEAEKKVETLLDFIEYDNEETYIDNEECYLNAYNFTLVDKIKE